jgi:hypothetical protein
MRSPILSLPPRNMKVNAIPFPIIDAGAVSSRFGPTMRHLAYTPFLNVLAIVPCGVRTTRNCPGNRAARAVPWIAELTTPPSVQLRKLDGVL